MRATHHMTTESESADGVVMTCPEAGCGRRVVVQRPGRLVVIDRGDFFALHTGGTAALSISTGVDG